MSNIYSVNENGLSIDWYRQSNDNTNKLNALVIISKYEERR